MSGPEIEYHEEMQKRIRETKNECAEEIIDFLQDYFHDYVWESDVREKVVEIMEKHFFKTFDA